MKLNLLFFVRLLMRHGALLAGIPVLLAVLVFLLTGNQQKTYTSKASVYTGISSGSGIDLENTRIDYMGTGIAYGNLMNLIKSRSTLETVGLRLFAQHMALDSADYRVLSREKYESLKADIPADIWEAVVPGDPAATYANFIRIRDADYSNFIYRLVHGDHPDYSIDKILGRIRINRAPSSDFLDIQYQSDDAAVCQNTLLILCDVFVRQNTELRIDQSDAVVGYFEDQLNKSTGQLKGAEDELLSFNKEHNIINYYEQTKHIAGEKEEFEIKYFQVQREFEGAKAVLDVLESKLETHERKRIASQRVVDLRKQLTELNFELGIRSLGLERDSISLAQNSLQLQEKQARIRAIESELRAQVDTLYATDYDTHGVASTSILSDWLDKTIAYEDARAQLQVMEQKRLEFEKLYRVFSPLGATMKRLERKIDIAEREYLSLLHSLGLAKLRQQNAAMQSNLKLAEVPYYPIRPEPSKRMMLVVVAGIAGLILVAFTILALEFLDGNLNTAPRAADRIGLAVSSIFPVIAPSDRKIDYAYLRNKAVNAISRNILLNQFKQSEARKPEVNLFFSTQENEGKTFICQNLVAKLCELGYRILHITYDSQNFGLNPACYTQAVYSLNDQLYRVSELSELVPDNLEIKQEAFDFVILEIAGIIKHPFPVKLASIVDYAFLVTRANRPWTSADATALALFKEATTGPEPTVILNGVKVLEMETVLGELPKKRSLLRQWVKRLVQFRFFTKQTVA